MKIPKLGDLTDLNKLKKMGSSLAESANVGGVMNKMKQAVGESGKLLDKAKSSVGMGASADKESSADGEETSPASQIQQSLGAIFAAQKAQLAAMNQLKQAVSALLKQVPAAQALSEAESDETDTSDDEAEEDEDSKNNDSQFRD
jgi:hypothetical protein